MQKQSNDNPSCGTMRVLGIDPGSVSGAYGFITPDGAIVGDLPVADGNVMPGMLFNLVKELQPDVAIVERVSAMPGNGAASMFKFGRAYGCILSVLACAAIRTELTTPTTWKKHFSLPGKDKEKSRELVSRLFPTVKGIERVKDHGRCEALLMAQYWMEKNRDSAA